MRIVVAPADTGACGHFRAIWPAEAMRAQGVDVEILAPGRLDQLPVRVGKVRDLRTGVVSAHAEMHTGPDVLSPGDFDVLVTQRPLAWRAAPAFELLREHGIRVVVDLDDDLTTVPPSHVAWAGIQPALSPEYNHRHLIAACKAADRVVVSTPALMSKFGGSGRGWLVRNRVPAAWLNARRTRPRGPLWLGWTGRVASHPDSLDLLRWRRLQHALGDVTFVVLGDAAGAQEQLGVDVFELPGVPLHEYTEMVAQFDIGVAPLARTPFNRAKSWLKPLDYAAAGVPFVCSDLPEYRIFVDKGCGVLAEKPRDWERELARLVKSPGLREELAGKGRAVAASLTIEAAVDDWLAAWTRFDFT